MRRIGVLTIAWCAVLAMPAAACERTGRRRTYSRYNGCEAVQPEAYAVSTGALVAGGPARRC